jgi:hypothetical protein
MSIMFEKFKLIKKNVSSFMEKYPRMFEITIFLCYFLGMALYFRYCASDAAEVWQWDHKILQHL